MKIKYINLNKIKELLKTKRKLKLSGTKTGYPSIDKTHDRGVSYLKRHPIIPNVSVYNAVSLISKQFGDAIALECLGFEITFDELKKEVKILSKAYKEMGINKGDIITISTENYVQSVVAFLAANRIGAVTTFLDSSMPKEEVVRYLNEFKSPLLINYDKNQEYNEFLKNNTKLKNIVTLKPSELNTKLQDLQNKKINPDKHYFNYSDMLALSKMYTKQINTIYGLKNDALILFTSGTTGNPKSVVLTNENIVASGIYMKNSSNVKPEVGERDLVCVPFCYPYGFVTSTLMSLLCGREAILAPNLSKEKIKYYLDKKPNLIFGSPAMLELIMKYAGKDQDLSSIHTFISGGDFLPESKAETAKEFFKGHGAKVCMCNGSGNAETSGASTNAVGVPLKPETVGKVLTGQNPIIVDPSTKKELKYGEVGTYYVAGKNVFKEYYKNPELTEQSLLEYNGKRYVNTGMRGFLDEDGYFTLTGRDSRFYITSSLNKVYCDRVQRIISMIDIVDNCAVVPKADEEKLYKNIAFVVLKDGIKDQEGLEDYLSSRCEDNLQEKSTGVNYQLKPYERPSKFVFLKEIPRTKADKIDYSKLQKMANDISLTDTSSNKTFCKK